MVLYHLILKSLEIGEQVSLGLERAGHLSSVTHFLVSGLELFPLASTAL